MFYRRLALFIAVVVTGLLALPGRAPAGTVTTRDGKTYVGAVAVNGAEVVVTTEQGRKAFPIASLARASFKSAANEKPPEGYGVRGEYFAGRNFRQLLLTRDDPAIDFKWGDDSIPHPSLSPGGREFSIRWTGRLLAAHSERHQLFANTDDGVRLWVGGKLLIDRWMDQSMAEASAEIDLVAGQEYELKVEYYNGAGPGLAHIAWQSPSMPRQPIPTTSLRLPKSPARPEGILLETPAADGGLPFRRILAPDTVGLRAEYYTDRDLKQLNFIRFDPNIDFHFHPDNLPDPASSPEGSVRWTGFVEVPKDNEYRFHVEAHLRCRLWVDNKLLIDKWDAQGGEFSSEYLTLEGGKKYAFKLEYASPAGFMLCRARWSSKNAGRDVIPSSAFSTPTDSRLAKPVIGLIYPSADTLATAPETLTLFAAGMSPNAPVQKVEFFDKNGLLWANTAQPYRFVWNRPPAGLYNIRAKLTDTLGVTALSDPFQLTVTGKGDGSLKAPWGDFFIANTEYTVRPRRGRTGGGDVVVANAYLTAGSASFNPQTGEFKLDNSVGSLTSDNQPDAGDFVVQPLTGDGQIVARIASLTPRDPNADAMAGITIRENLKSRCKHASLLWGVPANDPVVSFVRRQDHWMNPVQTERNAETPHWVKLVRHGSRVHAYTSPDGKTWDLIGSDRFETGPTVFVGLTAASKDKDRPATAVFDHVEVTAGSPALESSTKGFVTRSGSFVAADVWAIDDDRVRFTRDNKQDSIALADVARVCYRPVLAEHAKRLSPDQPGALMAGGDFLDGDIKALKDGQVSISSVLFGVKKIYL
ncbi:MAG TPA: PA14 domain-containing protein, partial [Tepidisphaeraceae bacterium]|nr:PA14 domain-containing protein [Tepidisphaeraceae bacterium]